MERPGNRISTVRPTAAFEAGKYPESRLAARRIVRPTKRGVQERAPAGKRGDENSGGGFDGWRLDLGLTWVSWNLWKGIYDEQGRSKR